MSTSASPPYPSRPVAAQASAPMLDWVFGTLWPDRVAARPRLLLAALAVGVLAGLVVPERSLGLGTFVVFLGVAAVVVAADRRLRTPARLSALALCLLLGSVVVLRDAEWVTVLCVLAALGVAAAVLVDVRSFVGVVVAAVAVPLAGVRGLPWLGRSIVAGRPGSSSWAVVRTVVVSVLLLAVFGGLFASADALFSSWLDVVVPDLGADIVAARVLVLVAVAGATLAFGYVAINPPPAVALPAAKTVTRTFEWLLPVATVAGLYTVFVAAQLTVMFGGHGYLARTTGITYAEYVHQGFGQMCVATVLTLGVVAAAATRAARGTPRDRLVLRVALGVLCGLTLVVVASALDRMHVYEQAYGFTRLRLLVSFFEVWIGLVLVLVLVAGVRLRASWLPMATVLTAAGTLLALAWLNPDAYIAEHNVARYQDTGKIDLNYLAGLSADAAPALTDLPQDVAACLVHGHDDWLEWNLGRARGRDLGLDPARCARQ
jgi:hypothetical protein